MADIKISALPAAPSTVVKTDAIPLVNGGITVKATPTKITIAALSGFGPPTTGQILSWNGSIFLWVTPDSFSGYSGASGISGFSGATGTSGFSGATGTSGFSGATGASGFSGATGTSGFSGVDGASGYSGATGASGFSGVAVSGYSGISGYSGSPGVAEQLVTTTSTDLAAIGNVVNTTGKAAGSIYFATDNGQIYVATGSTAAAPWNTFTLGTAITPA